MRTYRNFIAITSDSRFLVWMLKFSTLRHYVEEVGAELHGEGCLTCADLYLLMQWSAGYIRRTSPPEYHNFLVPSKLPHVLNVQQRRGLTSFLQSIPSAASVSSSTRDTLNPCGERTWTSSPTPSTPLPRRACSARVGKSMNLMS